METKKLVVLGVMIIGAILFLGAGPGFTGSAISEESFNDEIKVGDALAGSTIAGSFILNLQDTDLVKLEVLTTGEVGDWIQMEKSMYTLVPNQNNELFFTINVPSNAEERLYRAKLVLMYVQDFNKDSLLTNQILDYVDIDIHVTNQFTPEGTDILEFEVYNTEENYGIDYQIVLENLGNQETMEKIDIEITNQDSQVVFTESLNVDLYAFENKRMLLSIPNNLPLGRYDALLTINGQSAKSTFNIFPSETYVKKGDILFNEIIRGEEEIMAQTYVENTERTILTAKVSYTVFQNDVIVDEYTTQSQKIMPKEISYFEYVYDSEIAGVYDLKTELLIDNYVIDQENQKFYSSDAIGLEFNFYAIFGIIMILLVIAHYALARRRKNG